MNQLLVQYSYLQFLDFMTTLAFLVSGVREANPLVRFAIKYAPDPIMGLLGVKVLALGLGIYCWHYKRLQILARVNILFAVVVAWNMAALILGTIRTL